MKCKILAGDKEGHVVFLNRITLYSDNEYPFSYKKRKFPIKLAFARTINKAQGETFSNVLIDLQKNVLFSDTYMLQFHVSVLGVD